MRFWQLIRQSLHGVARARLRSVLTVLGIAISGGALVSMVSFAIGLQEQFEAPIQQLGLLNDVEVRPLNRESRTGPAKSAAAPRVLDEAALERFRRLPGVRYAYPDLRISQLTVAHGERSSTTVAVGLPREASLLGLFDQMLLAGESFSLGEEAEAILGEKACKDLGFDSPRAALGAKLQITAAGLDATDSGQFAVRKEQLAVRVVGVYRAPGMAAGFVRANVLLPVDTMQDLPGTTIERNLNRLRADAELPLDSYPEITVRAERPAAAFRLERQIRDMGFEARAVAGRIKEARRVFVFMEVLLAAVGTVGLVVAGLGVMNTLLMSVMERFPEIGIYKAIGASDGDVRTLFLTEAAVLGLAGGLAGLALARVVCWLLQWGLNQYAQQQGVTGPGDVFRFPLWLLAGAVAYTLLISLLSGVYPASRAVRVDPIQALRRG